MEENTQLPKEVVDNIENDASAYADSRQDHLTNIREYSTFNDLQSGYTAGATAYASKLHRANETIKVLTNDNNRLKGEVEGLKSAVEELKTISPDLEREAKEHAKTIANNSEHQLYVAQGYYNAMLIRNVRESAAGREDDKAHFDNWHRWLSDNGYTYDGEYYYDEDNNYFTPDQLWVKFK